MNSLPSVFISHGAPDLPLRSGTATAFLRQFSQFLPQPTAILALSAHWSTPNPTASRAESPQTIHDFSGFPAPLYQLTYPAPGAPQLAERALELLTAAGFKSQTDPQRGLDHGAWIPLLLAYPQANIPVAQLSIQSHLGADHHFQVGRALEPLRHEGVLILASGGATHNLRAFEPTYDMPPPSWVQQFDDWLDTMIVQGNIAALLNYRRLAPYAAENHPTDEHLLPLFVALGAGGTIAQGQPLHKSFAYGAFSMAAYAFA